MLKLISSDATRQGPKFMYVYVWYNVYVYIHNIHLFLSLSLIQKANTKIQVKLWSNSSAFYVNEAAALLSDHVYHFHSFSIVPFPLLKNQHPSQRARLAIAPFSWLRKGILKANSKRCRRSGMLLELFCIQTPMSPMSLACFWRARAGQGSYIIKAF